jgi:hypothetical protein
MGLFLPSYFFLSLHFLSLASFAPPGAARGQHGPHDPAGAAPAAETPVLAVDREIVLKAASKALRIHVVVDARTAHGNRAPQNVNDGEA